MSRGGRSRRRVRSFAFRASGHSGTTLVLLESARFPHMQKLPLVLILLGVGISLMGFLFGESNYPYADFRRQMEDMRIFGVETLQLRWVLAGSICLVLA